MSNPDPRPGDLAPLTIGAVAELAGKRTSSIRYYEQIGLLPPPRAANARPWTSARCSTIRRSCRAGKCDSPAFNAAVQRVTALRDGL